MTARKASREENFINRKIKHNDLIFNNQETEKKIKNKSLI
jgi:hypothetical protein